MSDAISLYAYTVETDLLKLGLHFFTSTWMKLKPVGFLTMSCC